MTTHRPYRSWRKFCMMERGVNAPHRRSGAQDDLAGVPHVSMDCGFLGEKESEDRVSPVLVIWERRHKITWDTLVPRKGTEFSWIAKRAAKFSGATTSRQLRHCCTSPPRREPDCARETASGRKSVQRDHRACGGARCQPGQGIEGCRARVPPDARILCWLVELAANRTGAIGSDGKTPRH